MPSTLRRLTAFLTVLLGLVLSSGSPPIAARGQSSLRLARYDEMVMAYRFGRTEEAVRVMTPLSVGDIDSLRRRWFEGEQPVSRQALPQVMAAAGMLHTECAYGLFRIGAVEPAEAQFLLGWRLIDALTDTSFRQRWYLVAGMFFHGEGYYQLAGSILEAGIRAFPGDPRLWLERGALEEARAAVASPWTDLSVPPTAASLQAAGREPMSHLIDAEAHLLHAASLDGTLVEVSLRLARVRGERGRRADATERLTAILAADHPPLYHYLANMFLADLHAREGHLDLAAAGYRDAMAAYPRSQVARTALAVVLRRLGRPHEALEVVLESLTVDRDHLEDPWWMYQRSQLQSLDDLLDGLREELHQ